MGQRGLIQQGNIDLYRQPVVQNPDGTISTVDSFSVNIGGKEILLPTVTPDGRHLSQEDAIQEFERTGRHLGVFDSPENATDYAIRLHNDYAAGKFTKGTHMDDQTTQFNQAIASDPEMQRLIGLLKNGDPTATTAEDRVFGVPMRIQQRLQELGITVPKGSWFSEGQIRNEPNTFLKQVLPIMAGAATLGIGLGAMGPGAAFLTGGGGAASGGTGAALTAGLPEGLSAGAMTPAALAGAAPGVGAATSLATPALTAGLPDGLSAGSMSVPELAGATKGGGILSTIGKYADQINAVGSGINSATQQAAENRMAQNDPYMQRARLDDSERAQALKDLYSINQTMNPRNSPFNPRPIEAPTGSVSDTLKNVLSQNETRLNTPGQYNATTLPSLQAGTMEKVGNWAGPILSTVGKLVSKKSPLSLL